MAEKTVTLHLHAGNNSEMSLAPMTPTEADEFVEWIGQRKLEGDTGGRITATHPDGTKTGVMFIQHIHTITYH